MLVTITTITLIGNRLTKMVLSFEHAEGNNAEVDKYVKELSQHGLKCKGTILIDGNGNSK